MMTIKSQKIDRYLSISPTRFSIVERLALDQNLSIENQCYQLSMKITLRSADPSEGQRLVLSFSKVRELLLNPGISALQFSFLNIVSVDAQWEDVNFKVFEDKQDIEFSFLCDDFDATLTG